MIGWPEGIVLAWLFLGVCLHASNNGKPRTGHYDLGSVLVSTALFIGLLYWGGLFA